MNKAMDKIKQAWNENPLAVLGVGALVATAASKLIEANTHRQTAKTWDREVARRSMMKNR